MLYNNVATWSVKMQTFSRVFNLYGKRYLYTETIGNGDETSTKLISRWAKNPELKRDAWTPMIKKCKYGDNAYSYENFVTRDTVLADNFRSSKVFDVTHRIDGQTESKAIGTIKDGVISTSSGDVKIFRFLKKIKGMIKNF